MKSRIAKIRSVAKKIPRKGRPKVFYQVWDDPLMAAGQKALIGNLIEMAGGRNIFDDVAKNYPRVASEEVLRRNPDIIIGPRPDDLDAARQKIRNRPGWQHITAVRQGRIEFVDGNLISRPSPRIVDGLEAVAEIIHGKK